MPPEKLNIDSSSRNKNSKNKKAYIVSFRKTFRILSQVLGELHPVFRKVPFFKIKFQSWNELRRIQPPANKKKPRNIFKVSFFFLMLCDINLKFRFTQSVYIFLYSKENKERKKVKKFNVLYGKRGKKKIG